MHLNASEVIHGGAGDITAPVVAVSTANIMVLPLAALPPADVPAPALQVAHALTEAARAESPTGEQTSPAMGYAAASSGQSSLSVRLSPQELGTVSIQIDRPAGAPATVTLTAERPETLALLQRDHAQLNQALDQAGVAPEGRVLAFHLAAAPGRADAPAGQPPNQAAPPAGHAFDAASAGTGGSASWQPPSSDSRQPQGQAPHRGFLGEPGSGPPASTAIAATRRTLSDRIDITA